MRTTLLLGTHPLLMQTPVMPGMLANGLGVEQPELGGGVVVVVEPPAAAAIASGLSGGSQPPFTQTHPETGDVPKHPPEIPVPGTQTPLMHTAPGNGAL